MAGFLSGDFGSGGLQGAMVGAFSVGVFHGIGLSMGDKVTAGKVLAHGMAGGVISELQGGKFGHGFASAAVTQLMSPVISQVNDTDTDFNAGRVAVAALVGGTTSAITGGKFANGALTAAFSRAYNDESQHRIRKQIHAQWMDDISENPNQWMNSYTPPGLRVQTALDLCTNQAVTDFVVGSIPLIGPGYSALQSDATPLDYQLLAGQANTGALILGQKYLDYRYERAVEARQTKEGRNSLRAAREVGSTKSSRQTMRAVRPYAQGGFKVFAAIGFVVSFGNYVSASASCYERYGETTSE